MALCDLLFSLLRKCDRENYLYYLNYNLKCITSVSNSSLYYLLNLSIIVFENNKAFLPDLVLSIPEIVWAQGLIPGEHHELS